MYTNATTYDRPTEPAVPEMEGANFDRTEAAPTTEVQSIELSASHGPDGNDGQIEPEPEPEPEPELAHAPESAEAVPIDGLVEKQQAEHHRELHTMVVVCPENSGPGDSIVIEWENHELAIEVPEGVAPGEEFEVEVDVSTMEGEGSHAMDPDEEFEVDAHLDEPRNSTNSMNVPGRDGAVVGAEDGTADSATAGATGVTARGTEPGATGRKKRKKSSAGGCCGAKPSKGAA
jgi:hypothetical protein